MRSVILPIVLILVSTLAYFLPSQIVDISQIDFRTLNPDFYRFYCLFTSTAFFLVTVYVWCLFLMVPYTNYKQKIVFLWLVSAETFTFGKHVVNKLLGLQMFRPNAIVSTLLIFSILCLFFTWRALSLLKSDAFDPEKSFIIIYKPKIFSVFSIGSGTCAGMREFIKTAGFTDSEKNQARSNQVKLEI
jgi:hypothetical protein